MTSIVWQIPNAASLPTPFRPITAAIIYLGEMNPAWDPPRRSPPTYEVELVNFIGSHSDPVVYHHDE